MSFTKFVFFGLIQNTRWRSRHLIGRDIFEVSAESTKLDLKPDLNVLFKVCVFRANLKTKMAALPNLSTKVAHSTPVHDMWPFGRLVMKRDRAFIFHMCIASDKKFHHVP